MQIDVIKFVSDLRQVGGFLGTLRYLPPIIYIVYTFTHCDDIQNVAEIFLKVALTTITLSPIKPTLQLVRMVLGSPFKIVSDSPHPSFKMAAVTKIDISFIVYCCCIINCTNVTAATVHGT